MLPSLLTRTAVPVVAVAAVLAGTTGCRSGTAGDPPTWVPQPNYQGNNDPRPQLPAPRLPAPSPSDSSSGSAPPPGPSGSAPTGTPATDPAVLATKLNQPTGLVVLPDGTALVGERTTGRILRVQPVPGRPATPVQRLVVDGSGDGGLLDLAISPTFDQDGLVYAYLSTATDNRVVHFALGSPPSAIVTGIPKGRTGNAGRLAFDATGALLIGTGDAGQPALAASTSSLAGKILRTSDIGRPLPSNPLPSSPVFSLGLRSVDGLCVDTRTGLRIAISAGTPGVGGDADEVNVIRPDNDYGWPGNLSSSVDPLRTLPPALGGGGGCAIAAGRLFVATSTGRSLAVSNLTQGSGGAVTLGAFSPALQNRYGRLATVVAAPDGALWLTTRNRDGQGRPTADDDRVIRISPSDDTASPIT
ncbi:PQQ-dependent sugar dehydrogenase [Jatrophihabitans sp.]|uniref:PQQ-dependent sugar dehydrogenase n=1 Tax=Jatrophihabitans sp. TaxID=1932789 RepID=UPI002B5D3DB8|nr:PQQ-dependent sugar dehydrogenase [Jatrophihabitans sp.]